MRNKTINYQQAITSPCDNCKESPCCSLLQLQQLTVATLIDLDFRGPVNPQTAKGKTLIQYNNATSVALTARQETFNP